MACATASKLGGKASQGPGQPTGRINYKTLYAAFSRVFTNPVTNMNNINIVANIAVSVRKI